MQVNFFKGEAVFFERLKATQLKAEFLERELKGVDNYTRQLSKSLESQASALKEKIKKYFKESGC